MNTKALILAAGLGTRMKSQNPKVLHEILGKTLVGYTIDAAMEAGAKEICLIVGHKAELVKETIGDHVSYALQKEQLGTGHAVLQALDFIGEEGEVIILCGDTPLLTSTRLEEILVFHRENKNAATVLSAKVESPTGYGRIIRDEAGRFTKIVEQKDATQEEAKVNEINGGMYVFEAKQLQYALSKLDNDNAQGEYYLTDTVEILLAAGEKVDAIPIKNEEDLLGVNSRVQLAQATTIMKERINKKHMENGITIVDPSNTYIEASVTIGAETIIEPGSMLQGKTEIGEGCIIGMNSKIKDSILKDEVQIESSTILESFVDEKTSVGPYAYIRPNSKIGKKVKIGDFVEIKNTTIGDGTKVSHLTYVGDSDVGKNVNFGCGTVTVNYDGQKKYRSTIKDEAFIGCNTNIVSPVTIEEGAYTAAGSTITKDVPKENLAIARCKQQNKEGWVTKKKNKK